VCVCVHACVRACVYVCRGCVHCHSTESHFLRVRRTDASTLSVCALQGYRPDTTKAWNFIDSFREKGIGMEWVTIPQCVQAYFWQKRILAGEDSKNSLFGFPRLNFGLLGY
jgi:hypothetical protein